MFRYCDRLIGGKLIDRKYTFSSAILGFIAAVPMALATTVFSPSCPKEIDAMETLMNTYPGWSQIVSKGSYYLNSIAFYAGDPKDLANLKPDIANRKMAKWSFSPKDTIYIVCAYNQTAIQLAQALPAKITRCEITFDQTIMSEGGFIPKKVTCY
ncbi:STY0301 family protein [Legionella tunisiensis]|uniref:STY0301 family protein n=1 Tax=Legionella tunisiensis TaxID=1034944 RepID=UPI00036F581C|nr:STY0301 family protein [Legionella tunisiensis]